MTWTDFSELLKDADAIAFLGLFIYLLVIKKALRLDREYVALETKAQEQKDLLEGRLAKRDAERANLIGAHEDELRRTREDYERRLVALEKDRDEFKAMALNALRLGERATKFAEQERG